MNQGPTNKKTQARRRRRPSEAAVDATPVQVVSRGLAFWFLLLAIGLAGLAASSLYFGLFVVAATFGSILLVAITLFAFFKYWPEDEALRPVVSSAEAPATPKPRKAMIQAGRVDGPPKARFMIALRDASRRQESIKISKEGAERFAKTIRYLLQNS